MDKVIFTEAFGVISFKEKNVKNAEDRLKRSRACPTFHLRGIVGTSSANSSVFLKEDGDSEGFPQG